jgi:hypothetical protein
LSRIAARRAATQKILLVAADGQRGEFQRLGVSPGCFDRFLRARRVFPLPKTPEREILRPATTGNPGNVG